MLDVLCGERPPEELWRMVRHSEGPHVVEYLLRFARRFRGQDLERITIVAAPFLDRVVRQLDSGSAERRALAVETLSLLGGRAYSRQITRALVARRAAHERARRPRAAGGDGALRVLDDPGRSARRAR